MAISNKEEVPVNVVGSSTFGRYPKISAEKTYNMFISDGWLVNYAGFQKRSQVLRAGEGRALYKSVRGKFLLAVQSSSIYRYTTGLAPQFIGNLDTITGEVSIDENLSSQICIVDGDSCWIYNYLDNTLTKQTLTFLAKPIVPSYVCYHNSFFLIGSSTISENPQNWYAFQSASAHTISLATQFSIQTKPDSAIAIKRLPGRGNNVLVMGTTVAEVWTQIGGVENYRRVQSFNIDNGTVSVSTIAASDEFIAWVGQNENNSPALMVTDGSSVKPIATDGIDFLLQSIHKPNQSTAFFFRQDGHLFYQFTFFNQKDNISLIYDFNNQQFYHVSDEDLNYHPARQIVYFNGTTYFISINDSAIYEMGTDFITYNYNLDDTVKGEEIPRIRICKTIRKDNNERFRAGKFSFWLEQGVTNDYLLSVPGEDCDGLLITESGSHPIISEQGDTMLAEYGVCLPGSVNQPRVDMSMSKNGNQSFSNVVSNPLNPAGQYRNQIRWHRMGEANELTTQLRFWGFQRFVAGNGMMEVF